MIAYPAWHLYSGRPYIPAAATNIAETFKRFAPPVIALNVKPIKKKEAA